MPVPEPLRYSPFRMYRRKSLYTGLYGTNYSGPTRPPGDTTDSAGVPVQSKPSPSPVMYTSGFSGEYAPHPGLMEMPGKDYQPYDSPSIPHIPRPSQPPALEPGEASVFEPGVRYEDNLMDEDSFELQMELLREQFGEAGLNEWENNEVASHIMQAHREEETSEFDADLREHVLEIQMAAEQTRNESLAEPNPELSSESVYGLDAMMYHPPSPELISGAADYELLEPQDFFDQQMQLFEKQFSQFDPAEFDNGVEMEAMFKAQEAVFDLPELEAAFMEPPTEAMGSLARPGSESLEQIIKANEIGPEAMMPDEMPEAPDYDDSLMTPELFEQEMSEAAEPMEPYSDPMEQYGGMIPQPMYEEQVPDMMDPYRMPGMMNPYMMPGPFEPGPMFDPGPGGGP